MKYKAYTAELLGTAVLTFAVLVSIAGAAPLSTPLAAALALTICVYTIGGISGCHINPAVTVGLFSIGKICAKDGTCYIIAQILGALCAMKLAATFGIALPELDAAGNSVVAFGELLGAFLLVFGICSVVFEKVCGTASGIVIGGSLLLGITSAASFSNGVLNPAVAFGIGSASLYYLLAPILGGIAAAQVYRWLQS